MRGRLGWALAAATLALAGAGCSTADATDCLSQLKPPGEVRGSLGVFVPCAFEAPACGDFDPAYHSVPGARLVFTSQECGSRSFSTLTADDGSYDMVLPEGRYTVSVEGGRPAAVAVVSGRRVDLNLREDLTPARRLAPVPGG